MDRSGDKLDSSAQSALQPDVLPSAEERIPFSKTYEPLSFPVIALLMPTAVFGVLARLGLIALMTYNGGSVFPLAYVNAFGCFVMGLCLGLKEPLLDQFYTPLHTALATGFCGSVTTFSSWQLDIFNAWINAGQVKRGGLRDFVDGVGVTTITLSLSVGSLVFGYRITSALADHIQCPKFPSRFTRYSWNVFSVLTYASTFLTYFLLPASFRHQATAALIFSFPGVITRYLLSVALNQRFKSLPAGTLAANILGTALLAAFYVLQRTTHPPSQNACSLLQGLIDGYCGCLITISTFAAEVRDLGRWKACRYVMISWGLGQVVMVLIFGSSIWTGHASKHLQATYTFS